MAELLKIFTREEFKKLNVSLDELIELSFIVNGTFTRAVFENGVILIKNLAESSIIKLSQPKSQIERAEIIENLYKSYTQQSIADMLGVSQATVSSVLHSRKLGG